MTRRTCPSLQAAAGLSAKVGSGTQKPGRPAPRAGLRPARSSLGGTRRSAPTPPGLRPTLQAEFSVKDRTGPSPFSLLRGLVLSISRKTYCTLRPLPTTVPPVRLHNSCPVVLATFRAISHPQGRKAPRVLTRAAILLGNHIPLFTPGLGFYICLSDSVMKMCFSLDGTSSKTWLYPSHLPSSQSPVWSLTHSEHSAHICHIGKQIND